jgi:hypothetical protein
MPGEDSDAAGVNAGGVASSHLRIVISAADTARTR